MTVPRVVLGGRRLLFLLAVVALGACASAGSRAGEEGPVAVEVRNNLIPPTALTVWAQPRVGGRVMVGTVAPSATRTLRFDPATTTGEYVLVAETTGGQRIASNPVVLTDEGTVVWDLTSNIATIR